MPNPKRKVYQSKSGPAIDPDFDDNDQADAALQRIVPASTAPPIGKLTTAARSVFDIARPAAAANNKRGGVRRLLDVPDPTKIKIDVGVPIAKRGVALPKTSKWGPVFALLAEPGMSVALPMVYKATLYAYIKKHKTDGQMGGEFVVRRDVVDATRCRLSRVA